MSENMDNFENEFMQKVRGEGAVIPEKKKIDKKWLLIGGVILVLAGVLVAAMIISRNLGEGSDEKNPTESFRESIVGVWLCEEGTILGFDSDGEFTRENDEGESKFTGVYEQDGSILTMEVLTYLEDGEVIEVEETDEGGEEYRLYDSEGTVFFENDEGDIVLECSRSKG